MAPAGGAAAPAAAAAAGGKPAAAAKAPEPEPEEEADEVRLAPPSARKACSLRVRTSTVHRCMSVPFESIGQLPIFL
jgi:hypothetical protein